MTTDVSTTPIPGRNRACNRPAPVRARSRPVPGSVTYGPMPAQPQPSATLLTLLPADPRSPGKARSVTRTFLSRCARPADADDAQLIASELTANAATAMQLSPGGTGHIELSLRMFPSWLLIEVTDSSPADPRPQLAADLSAEHSRGLAVVHQLSQGEWGWFPRPDGRKVVYATLQTPQPPTDRTTVPASLTKLAPLELLAARDAALLLYDSNTELGIRETATALGTLAADITAELERRAAPAAPGHVNAAPQLVSGPAGQQ